MKILVGTRRTEVAVAEAKVVLSMIKAAGVDAELKPIKTVGDTLDVALAERGEKDVYIKEVEEALLAGDIDAAVIGMSYIPVNLTKGIAIAAVTSREDAREAFVSTRAHSLNGLPKGATIGLSGARRRAQVFMLRPDILIAEIKGTVETRLRLLEKENVVAIIMAAADLKRLGIDNVITEYIPIDKMIPAVGQGAIAVEIRADDRKTGSIVNKACHNKVAGLEIKTERMFMKVVGNPRKPLGVHAQITPSGLEIAAFLSSEDEAHYVIDKKRGDADKGTELAAELATAMLAKLESMG